MNVDNYGLCYFEQQKYPQTWMTFTRLRPWQSAASASFRPMQITKGNTKQKQIKSKTTFTMNNLHKPIIIEPVLMLCGLTQSFKKLECRRCARKLEFRERAREMIGSSGFYGGGFQNSLIYQDSWSFSCYWHLISSR